MFWLRNKKIIFSYTPLSGGRLQSLKFVFIVANSADPNEMEHSANFISAKGVSIPVHKGLIWTIMSSMLWHKTLEIFTGDSLVMGR